MRIAAGIWKGRILEQPDTRTTRPTQDRIKQALVSSVLSFSHLSLQDMSVLDAFAGSGAVGLELLSRGASSLTLVERDKKVFQTLTKNVASLGDGQQIQLICADAMSRVAYRYAPFDIVFLDPPYALDPQLSQEVVNKLMEQGQLATGALIVHERDASAAALNLDGVKRIHAKRYSDTAIEYWRYDGGEERN